MEVGVAHNRGSSNGFSHFSARSLGIKGQGHGIVTPRTPRCGPDPRTGERMAVDVETWVRGGQDHSCPRRGSDLRDWLDRHLTETRAYVYVDGWEKEWIAGTTGNKVLHAEEHENNWGRAGSWVQGYSLVRVSNTRGGEHQARP